MNLIEFVQQYAEKHDEYTKVVLMWYWFNNDKNNRHVYDEEYSFEGKPSEFVEKYVYDYDCLTGYDVFDVEELVVVKKGCGYKLYIEILSY